MFFISTEAFNRYLLQIYMPRFWIPFQPLFSRCVLHPGLHPLHPHRQVDTRSSSVQTVAGHGLPALFCISLQHRPHQLWPIPVCHQSSEWHIFLTPAILRACVVYGCWLTHKSLSYECLKYCCSYFKLDFIFFFNSRQQSCFHSSILNVKKSFSLYKYWLNWCT